jgi:hypothetical protein
MNSNTEIQFYGDTLTAHRDAQGQVMVAVKPIVEGLGLNWSGQLKRLRNDPDLGMDEISIPTLSGVQHTLCIPLEQVPALLLFIKPSQKMASEVRDKLSLYRREAFRVLWQHFGSHVQQAVSQHQVPLFTLDELKQEMILSVRETMRLEFAARLPAPTLTPGQQREVQEGVKRIAYALIGSGLVTREVAFARTWRALKEHFGVAKYEQIRADRWPDVQAWLRSRAT